MRSRRLAYIYVRQSSLKQVYKNQESQLYQYRLQQRAQEFGWPLERIRVIDSDLGSLAKKPVPALVSKNWWQNYLWGM
jgi:DNA invertase Pin-like site-specific DNA recombinase